MLHFVNFHLIDILLVVDLFDFVDFLPNLNGYPLISHGNLHKAPDIILTPGPGPHKHPPMVIEFPPNFQIHGYISKGNPISPGLRSLKGPMDSRRPRREHAWELDKAELLTELCSGEY